MQRSEQHRELRRPDQKNFSDFGADFEYYLQPVGAAGQNEDEMLLLEPCGTSIDGIEKCPNDVAEVAMHQVDHNAGSADVEFEC